MAGGDNNHWWGSAAKAWRFFDLRHLEEGIVTKVYSSTAWVKCTKSAACETCKAKSFCHTMGEGGGDDDVEVEAINAAGAKVSFLVYMVPVLLRKQNV